MDRAQKGVWLVCGVQKWGGVHKKFPDIMSLEYSLSRCLLDLIALGHSWMNDHSWRNGLGAPNRAIQKLRHAKY